MTKLMTIGQWIVTQQWLRGRLPSLYDTSSQSRWYQNELERHGPRAHRTADEWDERLMEWLLD